jgi:hypothetical protein
VTRFFEYWSDFVRRHFRSNSHPLFFALLAQLVGTLLAIGLALAFSPVLFDHLVLVALLQGVCAVLAAMLLRAPIWWLFIHLVFMPCAVLANSMALPCLDMAQRIFPVAADFLADGYQSGTTVSYQS